MEKLVKTALVTGASGGLGLGFARQLAGMGYEVILVSRNKDKLAKVKEELENRYRVKAFVLPCDLAQPGAAQRLFDEYRKSGLPELDLLVNNAGSGVSGACIELPLAAVNEMLALNIIALTELCMLFGKYMADRGQGYILNVGSIAGKNAVPYFANYSASKWYVLGYSLALARELKSRGVSLTCTLPGFIRTGFDEHAGIKNEKYKRMTHNAGVEPGKVVRASLRALFKKRMLVTPGFSNKLTAFFTQLLPKTFSAWVMKVYLDGIFK